MTELEDVEEGVLLAPEGLGEADGEPVEGGGRKGVCVSDRMSERVCGGPPRGLRRGGVRGVGGVKRRRRRGVRG